jgi:hypothetical protein
VRLLAPILLAVVVALAAAPAADSHSNSSWWTRIRVEHTLEDNGILWDGGRDETIDTASCYGVGRFKRNRLGQKRFRHFHCSIISADDFEEPFFEVIFHTPTRYGGWRVTLINP